MRTCGAVATATVPVNRHGLLDSTSGGSEVLVTTTKLDHASDVVSYLKEQHQVIKTCLQEVFDATGEAREEAFLRLRRLLAVHETAEEEVVHPRARFELADGVTIVDQRLQEEHEAKETLAELEKMDLNSSEFDTAFAQFRQDVIAHAEAEESQEFNQLAQELDDRQLARMRRAVEMAEKFAPTRPHAGIESAGANMLAGPFAAMLDRVRDAIS
jgi:hemerythrin superfamily protein